MSSYKQRRELYCAAVLREPRNKHNFLTRAHLTGEVDQEALASCCETVKQHKNNADFVLIKLVRFLFFPHDALKQKQDEVLNILSNFSFWPRKDKISARGDLINKSCFWSENHIFMYLSSAHLTAQMCRQRNASCTVSLREEHLLLIYLTVHCEFEGVYEVNSAVYLPYTLSSLLNLYDYSEQLEIREKALFIIDKILYSLLLVCDSNGNCTLSASARQKENIRKRNYGHNINQVVRLITGKSGDFTQSTSVSSFFLTSCFEPSALPSAKGNEENWLRSCLEKSGYSKLKMNHSTSSTRDIYLSALDAIGKDTVLSCEDLVPFYWSAGLVTNPTFVSDTKKYMEALHLSEAPSISLLGYVPKPIGCSCAFFRVCVNILLASSVMGYFSTYACGQDYTGINLNVYRSPNLNVVMTSFDNYNVNLRSYQQNAWMVNFSGAPLWSQSGQTRRQLLLPGFNSYGPSVAQNDNIMVVAYSAPLSRQGLFSLVHKNNSFVLWPASYFDSEWRRDASRQKYVQYVTDSFKDKKSDAGNWWIAQRGNDYLGLYCSHETTDEVASPSEELYMREIPPDMEHEQNCTLGRLEAKSFLPHKRFCAAASHVWVICVGDDTSFDCIENFIEHCINNVKTKESVKGNKYDVVVNYSVASVHRSIELRVLK